MILAEKLNKMPEVYIILYRKYHGWTMVDPWFFGVVQPYG